MSMAQKRRRGSPASSRKRLHTEDRGESTTTTPDATKTSALDSAYAEFSELMRGIGVTLAEPSDTTPVEPAPAPVPATRAKPKNPWAGKVKRPAKTWGASVHQKMHFAPTDAKPYHGVWGTRKLSEVREWVNLACDSIYRDDDFVVAAEPGEGGGHNFLVDMDGETVGYLSGSKIPSGARPPAKHLAVYVNKKGYPATAFPCTPEIF